MTGATAPEGRWWLDPGLARLAFGSQFARPQEGLANSATHLAFLPPDALALDLSDPAQAELGDYRLQELAGQGGMGVVYRAWQKSLEREVAVKLLSAGPWASEEFIASFRREARNAASLQHPNIVAVYEMGEQDGLIYYAMQLVRGTSLAETLRERGTLPAREAADLLRTIAEAVDYAHRMGVLHLDLKPGNVLLDERGVALVTDFGLARRLGQAPSVENEQVSGTPSYMAPEQAQVRSQGLSVATDIWGMGAILYEALTGVPPFTGRDPREILQNVLHGTVRKLSRHARIPPDLEAICLRCLRKDPGDRYASARELADDLGRYLEYRSVRARPLNFLQRTGRWARREPRLATASAMVVAALVTGLLATTHQWSRAEVNAGIASERAASQFGLHIVAHAIQDEAYNRTRFAIICLPHTLDTPPPSGHDCTSLIVSVPNQPGAVHDLLVPLKKHGVSMTRFESRPARTGQWEYYFYIDIDGHPSQPHVTAALTELRSLCAYYKVLGTYPVSS